MKIQILENCYPLDRSETPSILLRGTIMDLSKEQGTELIERGLAVELKEAKEEKSATPSDSWTLAELKKFAEDNKIDLKGASTKAAILSTLQA